MSDLELRMEVLGVLAEELAQVTPAMVEAGSRAWYAATVEYDQRGRRQPRQTSAADTLTAIWRAMLAAKLGIAP